MLGEESSCYIRLCQVRSCYILLWHVRQG